MEHDKKERKLLTPEQAKVFLRENAITDAKGLQTALEGLYGAALQQILEAELEHELGYSKYNWKDKNTGNSRNGHSKKTVRTNFGEIELAMPRDTDAEFEPRIVKKHERSVSGRVEETVLSLYAHGMSVRDIGGQIEKIYGVDISADLVSGITDRVLPLAREWQNRQLDEVYPIIYLDGMVFKVCQDGQIVKKTVYIVYGISIEGKKDVLGIWIGEAESSKFWMKVLVDMKNRGVKDIFIACVDGLNGFGEAIAATFPKTEVQRCIVHQVRTSTKFVSYKELKGFCTDMKQIYQAPNETAGLEALDAFEAKWGKKYSYAVKSWRDNWSELSTFFRYPEEIRRLIYTTNPIESLNRRIRKATKTKSSFPTDDSVLKIIYLVVMECSEKWTLPVQNWGVVLGQLRVYFEGRVDAYL